MTNGNGNDPALPAEPKPPDPGGTGSDEGNPKPTAVVPSEETITAVISTKRGMSRHGFSITLPIEMCNVSKSKIDGAAILDHVWKTVGEQLQNDALDELSTEIHRRLYREHQKTKPKGAVIARFPMEGRAVTLRPNVLARNMLYKLRDDPLFDFAVCIDFPFDSGEGLSYAESPKLPPTPAQEPGKAKGSATPSKPMDDDEAKAKAEAEEAQVEAEAKAKIEAAEAIAKARTKAKAEAESRAAAKKEADDEAKAKAEQRDKPKDPTPAKKPAAGPSTGTGVQQQREPGPAPDPGDRTTPQVQQPPRQTVQFQQQQRARGNVRGSGNGNADDPEHQRPSRQARDASGIRDDEYQHPLFPGAVSGWDDDTIPDIDQWSYEQNRRGRRQGNRNSGCYRDDRSHETVVHGAERSILKANIPSTGLLTGSEILQKDTYDLLLEEEIDVKEFKRSSNLPKRGENEPVSIWYTNFVLHGAMYGVFIPPAESFMKTKPMGRWWDSFYDHHAKKEKMSALIHWALRQNCMELESAKDTVSIANGDGYQALHNMMRPYHPVLQDRRKPKNTPRQKRNESFGSYLLRFREFLISEASLLRRYEEEEALDMSVANLRAEYRKSFAPLMAQAKRDRQSDGSLPFRLQIQNLATTFNEWAAELDLEVTESGKPEPKDTTARKETKSRNALLRHIAAAADDEASDEEIDIISSLGRDEISLLMNAIQDRPRGATCDFCGKEHETNECFKLRNYVKAANFLRDNPTLAESLTKQGERLKHSSIKTRDRKPPGKKIARIVEPEDDDDVEDVTPGSDEEARNVTAMEQDDSSDDSSYCSQFDDGTARCNAIRFKTPETLHEFVDYDNETDMDEEDEDVLESVASMFETATNEADGVFVAQVDQGSQVTTTSNRRLIWAYRPLTRGRMVNSATGHRTRPIGEGYLKVPDASEEGFKMVRVEHNPGIPGTYLSPHTIAKENSGRSSSIFSDYETGEAILTVHSRINRARNVHIRGTLKRALFYTKALILPSEHEQTAPLPRAQINVNVAARRVVEEAIAGIDDNNEAADFDIVGDNGDDDTATNIDEVNDRNEPEPEPPPRKRRLDDPIFDPEEVVFCHALNRDALRLLWHQRLGHMHHRRVSDLHRYCRGIPNLPMSTEVDSCPVCLRAKLHKANKGKGPTSNPTEPLQGLSVDFGFVVQGSKDSERLREYTGLNGETCYCIITDHFSGMTYGKTFASKAPPIEWFTNWLTLHAPQHVQNKFVRFDPGGDLGNCREVLETFKRFGYEPEVTGADASHQNPFGERPHRTIGDRMRAMLLGADLEAKFWPYAFRMVIRLSNIEPHGDRDGSPIQIITGKKPDLKGRLRTFGCRVFARSSGGRTAKLSNEHSRSGIFLGYTGTMQSILYFDLRSHSVKTATHARFDEGMADLDDPPPNVRQLRIAQGRPVPAENRELRGLDFDVTNKTFSYLVELEVQNGGEPNEHLGFEFNDCKERFRAYVSKVNRGTPATKVKNAKRFVGAYVVSINGAPTYDADSVRNELNKAYDGDDETVRIVLAPEKKVRRAEKHTDPLHLTIDALMHINAIRSAPGEGAPTLTDDETATLVSSLHLVNATDATAEEKAMGSFTRRKLLNLKTWEHWRASEEKQLDAMEKQGMYGSPVLHGDIPKDAIVLRQHWRYYFKADGTRKARNCCDGSRRAAPELHDVAQTYSSCIEQPCMRLFFALAAALNMTIVAADATNAYANSPPPEIPTYVWVDDQYISWYRRKHGVTLSRDMVMPVLHALQGHPESGALWEKHINGILHKLGFKNTTHEKSLYRTEWDGKTVLLCRQVDDIAVACEDQSVCDEIISLISSKVDMINEGLLKSFNGVDVDQTASYTKVHVKGYIEKVCVAHGWATKSESATKPIEPLSAHMAERLGDLEGPEEGTKEHEELRQRSGFSYRQLLGELLFAYVVARVDIGYAIVFLSRFAARPHEDHYKALKRVCKYLRMTSDWGILYWRSKQNKKLPEGTLEPLHVDDSDLPEFLSNHHPLSLVTYVDSAHATCKKTRRSVTGYGIAMAGGVIAFRSKLQATVATSSTEAEFVAAVQACKTVLYLRSVLKELDFDFEGPSVIYEDNMAAIAMINSKKPTERTRHIDVQHFAIQEWRDDNKIVMRHLPGAINPADSLTKPLGWVLHHRHVRRLMGHYGRA